MDVSINDPIFQVMEDHVEPVEETHDETHYQESGAEEVMTDYEEEHHDEVDSMIGGESDPEDPEIPTEENTDSLGLVEEEQEEEEEGEEEEYEEVELQKFKEDTKESYIMNNHPELIQHNNEEIAALAKVTRDENRKIIDPLHETNPWITKYERARILGSRAKQINHDADVFVNVPDNIIDGYSIALLEYKAKKIPFIIRRPIPGGGSEYWRFEDLEQIDF